MENRSNWPAGSDSVADNYKNLENLPVIQPPKKTEKIRKPAPEAVREQENNYLPETYPYAGNGFTGEVRINDDFRADIGESNELAGRVLSRLNAAYTSDRQELTTPPEFTASQELTDVPESYGYDGIPVMPGICTARMEDYAMPEIQITPVMAEIPRELPAKKEMVNPDYYKNAGYEDAVFATAANRPRKPSPKPPAPPRPPMPAPSRPPVPPKPQKTSERCFSEHSRKYGDELQKFIYDEISDYKYYMALSRKAPSRYAASVIKAMAKDEERHAKRLSGAYYLITGKNYDPSGKIPVPVERSFEDGLRKSFRGERNAMEKYRGLSKEIHDDSCLSMLLEELSKDEERHSQELLELINGSR